MLDLQELAQLYAAAGRDRELLQRLMRAAAQLAQALSGMQLQEPPESVFDLPEWLQAYDRAATAANAPTYREWMGLALNPLPQEPPFPWPVLVAEYAAANEPGIAEALRVAAQAYAAIAREGSAPLQRAVSDVVVRRWAQARLQREQTTGRGSGLGPRPLLPASSGIGSLLAVGAGLLLAAKGGRAGVLAALGAGFLLSRGNSQQSATGGVPGAAPSGPANAGVPANVRVPANAPSRYAAEKRQQLLNRWNFVQPRFGSLGDALTVYAPRLFPGIPPVAFLGFTAIATSRSERTTANELGFFQTPQRTWERLQPTAEGLIGRSIVFREWADDIEAQTVIGLLDLKEHLESLIRTGWHATDGTQWQCELTFAGFSAGTGGVHSAWSAYRSALEILPESERFTTLGERIAADWSASGAALTPANAHPNPAHTWTRTAQKLSCGRVCAVELERLNPGESYESAWFPTFPVELEVQLARAAAGLVP